MPLKITLKPNEKIIIGGAVVTNGSRRNSCLVIENDAPLLRERDIIGEQDADTPCKRIYFTVQLMYIDEENLAIHQHNYWKLVEQLLEAAPRLTGFIDRINEEIVNRRYYKALKLTQQLIDYEQEVVSRVQQCPAHL